MTILTAFTRFTRPHTIIATSLQITGLFIIAGCEGASCFAPTPYSLLPTPFPLLLVTLISGLAANIYIVGLNQITDVAIDRINKPYLPLAAGDFTLRQGRLLVLITGILALTLAATQSTILLLTIAIAAVIGSVYSLPPAHLKMRAIWAALSIAFVRGFVVNIGLYLHFHQALQPGQPIPWLYLLAITLFFFGFSLVIALYKDIPDLPGDKQYHVRTFTVSLGPRRVFNIGRWLITGFYLLPLLPLLPTPYSLLPLLAGHLLILALFWLVSRQIAPADPTSMTRFYFFFWTLFYAEYVLLAVFEIVQVNI